VMLHNSYITDVLMHKKLPKLTNDRLQNVHVFYTHFTLIFLLTFEVKDSK